MYRKWTWILVLACLSVVSVSLAQAQNISSRSQCRSGEEVTFMLLTSHTLDKADAMSSVLTFNLSACLDGCVDDPRCLAINIQNSPSNDFCSYYHQVGRLSNETATTSTSTSEEDLPIYYLEKTCLKGACKRLFAFEMVSGKDLQVKADVVIRNISEKVCLESCLNRADAPCLSVTYDKATADCALRSKSRFTNPQDFKEAAGSIQYFDNNCKDELPEEPVYEMVAKNFATHFSDTDYVDVSLSQCARLCQESPDYPCRAFFFGHTVLGRFCGLMHLSAAAVATIPGGNFPVDGVNLYQPRQAPSQSQGCPADKTNFVLRAAQTLGLQPMASSAFAQPALCLDQCRSQADCAALTIDYANAKCNYFSAYKAQDVTVDGMVSLYTKTCIQSSTAQCRRDWAFERIDGQGLAVADKVLETFTSTQCMTACLEESKFQCKSFDYNTVSNECRMSRLDRYSVNLRLMDRRDFTIPSSQPEITFYENNCFQEPSQFCYFDAVKGAEISVHDALVVDRVNTEEDCKRACQQQTAFNCRRYAFISNSMCILTHYTLATAPHETVIRHESSSSFGEIVACYNVSVECGSTMTAHIHANREYDGIIYARGKSDLPECGQVVKQQFHFDLNLPLAMRNVESCNTVGDEEGDFRNTIVLQHNAHVVTALDQTFGLQCKYDLHAKEELTQLINVNASLVRMAEASPDIIRYRVKLPQIRMQILGVDGNEITHAELGTELVVRIDMEDSEDVYGLSIRNMFATDGRHKNNMTLVDVQGCPAENLIRNFRQVNAKTLEARMEVFAFPDDNRIIVEAEVQTCRHRCKPVICPNGAESYGRRKRRATDGDGDNDDQGLDETVARSTLRKTVTITSQKFTLPLTNDRAALKINLTGMQGVDASGLLCYLPHVLAIVTVLWFLTETAAISITCFLKKRIDGFQEKLRNAEGIYNYGPFATYATVPRKVARLSPPQLPSQDSSSC